MMKHLVNPFELSGKWFKANLHSHTTTSDGDLSVADRVAQYRKAGYDVLAITDHRVTNNVRGLSDEKMLVISGMEYHPPCPTSEIVFHLVALHIPQGFSFEDPQDAKRCAIQIKKVGGESVLAHPYWNGQRYEDFKYLLGSLAAMEVYNSTCDVEGRASSENEWSHCLDRDYLLPALGNDDTHDSSRHDLFGCWTWFKMPLLNAPNVLKALRCGACYASCGPVIHNFRIKDNKVQLRCSPVKKIYFIGNPGTGSCRRAEKDKSIKTYSADVPNSSYVRAVVVDAAGRKAWTNPILIKNHGAE
jgi:hypothetical protein